MEPKVTSMNKVNVKTTPKTESTLKGTFISVLLVGAFILLLWAGIYALFLTRL